MADTSLAFLTKPANLVAPQLLGWKLLVQQANDSWAGGIITETEAYTNTDAASHSFGGQTQRNTVMFGPPGYAYVYFTYGMHWCLNIVTGQVSNGEAVLIRAIQPTDGLEIMQQRRNFKPNYELTNGPAKLCQALGITGKDNGTLINGTRIKLVASSKHVKFIATPRIGIRKATEKLWRFVATS